MVRTYIYVMVEMRIWIDSESIRMTSEYIYIYIYVYNIYATALILERTNALLDNLNFFSVHS